jgi:aspartyl-tRNA(Asn)/glutamyl-tRNA(Gln) amidotransferase subunit B
MRSSDEAVAYLGEVKQALQFVGVSTCDMEKGHLRCDANVSVRLKGAEQFGIRAEVKNLNSFRFLKQAIEYEIARQVAIAESGGRMFQETRLFDPDTGETVGMRSKEDAHDYRYFPEPDLVPLRVGEHWLAAVRATMPELPAVKRKRFIEQYGLSECDADVLTQSRAIGEYYDEVVGATKDPKTSANWVMGDLAALLKTADKAIGDSPVSAKSLGELLGLIAGGELSGKLAKEVLEKMFESGDTAPVIMEREGLRQISDSGALGRIVDDVIAANPKQAEQYRGGKTAVIGFLVVQVMKVSRGQANPAAVNELLKAKLS